MAEHIHFIGIGGIGMSALARYILKKGIKVSGYDAQQTTITKALESEGAVVYHEPQKYWVEKADIVVYTPAIPEHFLELQLARQLQKPLYKRAAFLGKIVEDKEVIAVAGTHGKTSMATLLSYLLYETIGCNAFLGGIANNYQTNFLYHPDSNLVVVEADEYDKSFLHLFPKWTIIGIIEPDHLECYSSFEDLVQTFKQFGLRTEKGILIHRSSERLLHLCEEAQWNILWKGVYSLKDRDSKEYKAVDFSHSENLPQLNWNEAITLLMEHLPRYFLGEAMQENALAACTMAYMLKVPIKKILQCLKTYKGVQRRTQILFESTSVVYIDDYAHHPTEIERTLKAIKERYKNYALWVAFQPHLYSRTKYFCDDFARVLSLADRIFLLPVYPARETPDKGISEKILFHKLPLNKTRLIPLSKLRQVAEEACRNAPCVFITMGAGNIGELAPTIAETFKKTCL